MWKQGSHKTIAGPNHGGQATGAIVKFKPGKEMKEKVAQLLPTLLLQAKNEG